jgi:hypothetical protein
MMYIQANIFKDVDSGVVKLFDFGFIHHRQAWTPGGSLFHVFSPVYLKVTL